jgi:hypothetical protein
MAGYVIILAFGAPPAAPLTETLQLTERLRLVRGEDRPELWISWSGFHEIEPALAAALAAGQVSSAALLPAVPSPDHRWILTEWRGRLAVHTSIAHQLDPRFWAAPSRYDVVDLRVFPPSGDQPGMAMTRPPGQPRFARPAWVETVAEYRAAVDTDRQALITAPVQQILSRMRDWFGELADDRVGGAVAVLAMSGVTPSTQSQVVLRSPAALGLRRVTGATTLPAHGKAGRIAVRARGVSSGRAARAARAIRQPGRTRAERRSLAARLAALAETTGARYGVLAELFMREDTEVLIDTGLIFEQETLNGVQNLAIAFGSVLTSRADQQVTTLWPAWCLNRHLAPPGGQPIRPTSLFLPLTAAMDQGTVWSIVERPLESFGARI